MVYTGMTVRFHENSACPTCNGIVTSLSSVPKKMYPLIGSITIARRGGADTSLFERGGVLYLEPPLM